MDIDSIKKLLMSYEDYQKIRSQVPYIYKLQKDGYWLYCFGSQHSFNPDHPQFPLIKNNWHEFLEKTKKDNRVVFVEGGVRDLSSNEIESIQNDAEVGLMTYIAHKDSVEVDSPEPTLKEEIVGFEKLFTKEEVSYYYFARMVYQWNCLNHKPSFEDYIIPSLKSDEKKLGWKDFDFSLTNMKIIHQKLFNEKFDENNKEFFYSIINPTIDNTTVNKFSHYKGITRDAYIVKKVIEKFTQSNSIFMVFSFAHAIMQEPAYKQLLNL